MVNYDGREIFGSPNRGGKKEDAAVGIDRGVLEMVPGNGLEPLTQGL